MWKKLIEWSENEFSFLPWRKKRSLYSTLVSEIMLQQTTVGTVLNKYPDFLKKYPSIKRLSNISEEKILEDWKGLGYYRRAKNLRKASIDICKNFDGEIPNSYDELIQISGVGDYTAQALLSIGKNQEGLAIDANLERVLSRLFLLKEKKGPKLIKKCRELEKEKVIQQAFKKFGARALNEALMDLGRVFCQARRADCILCPMKKNCQAYLKGIDVLELPTKHSTKSKEKFELKLLRIVCFKDNQILAYFKKEGEWLSGQWELPSLIIETNDKSLLQYERLKKKLDLENLESFKTSITKYKIENIIYPCSYLKAKSLFDQNRLEFLSNKEIKKLSTASLKALKKLEHLK